MDSREQLELVIDEYNKALITLRDTIRELSANIQTNMGRIENCMDAITTLVTKMDNND